MTGRPILFQCTEEDFEGDLNGAIQHATITGHPLNRTGRDGTVTTVSLHVEEDDGWPL